MSNKMSSILVNEIDILDGEILLLITKGNPSSYAVWASMNRKMQGQGLAYVNVKKRIIRMVSLELIQQSKLAPGKTSTIRGRKEYELTRKGIVYLIDHLISHWKIEDIETLTEYHNSADKQQQQAFETFLRDRIFRVVEFADLYYKATNQRLVIAAKIVPNIRIGEIKDLSQLTEVVPSPVSTTATYPQPQHPQQQSRIHKKK